MTVKKRIYGLLHPENKTGAGGAVDVFLMALIIFNVICILLESVPSLLERYAMFFYIFDLLSVMIFSIEYLLRVWTADQKEGTKRYLARIQYMKSFEGLIDLLSIVPFYLPFLGFDLRFLRILRVIRIFRLFKLARYVSALTLVSGVIKGKKEELGISIVFTMFILMITSALMYFVEKDAQPDKFTSIPETMWWAVITLTTVGYGDVYPITIGGKVLGGLIALTGIFVLALPVAILAGGYTEALAARRKEPTCPHCGKSLSATDVHSQGPDPA